MPVNFPNSPSNGQVLTTNTGIRYTYSTSQGRWNATTGYASSSELDKYLQVANSTSFATTTQLDNYLQVANSTSFASTSSLDAYLQVANSTSFATTSQLDNYLQVANSSTAGTNTSVVYTYANFLGG